MVETKDGRSQAEIQKLVRRLRAFPKIGPYGKGILAKISGLPHDCGVYKHGSLSETQFKEGWFDQLYDQ
jgi:hypothetical protein